MTENENTKMISVAEAEKIILSNLFEPKIEEIDFLNGLNRILAEDIIADRPFPPFNRVTMDGIAINFDVFANGQSSFKIEKIAPAGSPQSKLENPENCIEVMTGAMLPENTDTIIRYEDLKIENTFAQIENKNIKKGQNIHGIGTDRAKNEVLIPRNKKINPADIGIIATVGKSKIKVKTLPKILIISTGNELVEVNQKPAAHQIRTSNAYTLAASLQNWGISATMAHLPDNETIIETQLRQWLQNYDALILSGGVSTGKFDFIPTILEELGVKKRFHQVAQRPGKPFWFGQNEERKCVFALPGNPVSTFMCLNRYVKFWLENSLEQKTEPIFAILGEDIIFNPPLTYFLQVQIKQENAQTIAYPVVGGGSGDLANLSNANAFLELPAEKNIFKKGEVFRFFGY